MEKFKRLQINPIQTLVRAALFTSCLSMANTAFAEDNIKSNNFPYMPGFTVTGLSGDLTTGYIDAMLPFFDQPNSMFYVDPQGLIQTGNNYTVSVGTGYRYLSESAGILGVYVFGDYNHSSNGNSFWFVSPGVERLGDTIDFGANLYIPTGAQRQDLSSTTGLGLGTYDYITYQGHSEFDGVFKTFESVGMGGDAEIGVRIPMTNNPKFYLGGYYFSPEDADDNVTGVTARLEVPLTDQLTFLISDGYDNVENNTFKLGISYNFGGRKNSKAFKGDLTERMVDPIHRNLAAVSGSSKTGEPIIQTNNQRDGNVLVRNDIAFFNVARSSNGNGTYENPFNEMTQANVDTALGGGNNNFYVNSGIYDVGETITLTNTNLYGRQSYHGNPFVQSAVGDNRPLFDFELAGTTQSAFELMGSQNLFDSVKLQGGDGVSGNGYGIAMDNADDAMLSIRNSEVQYFNVGIDISNTGIFDLEITDSNVHDNDFSGMFFDNYISGAGGNATIKVLRSSFNDNINNAGMQLQNGSENLDVTLTDSSFDNNGVYGMSLVNEGGNAAVTARGASFDGNGSLGMQLINSSSAMMSVSLINSSFNENINNRGIEFQNSGIAEFFALNSSFSQNGEGVLFLNLATGDLVAEFTGSSINQNAVNGINFTNLGNVEFSAENSNFDQNDSRGMIFVNRGTATIDVTDSSFDQNAATGMLVQSVTGAVSTDINVASSTFNQNVNGLAVTTSVANTQINVDVLNSVFDQNSLGMLLVNTGIDSNFITTATDSVFTNNTSFGVEATNSQASTTMDVTLNDPEFSENAADTNNPSANVNWTINP